MRTTMLLHPPTITGVPWRMLTAQKSGSAANTSKSNSASTASCNNSMMSTVLTAQFHQQQNHDINSNNSTMPIAKSTIPTATIAYQQQQQHNANSKQQQQHTNANSDSNKNSIMLPPSNSRQCLTATKAAQCCHQ